MDFLFLKLANGINWMASQAKKQFVYLTDDPYLDEFLEKGNGPTWYLSLYAGVFIYKAVLSAYLLSQQDELSAGENFSLFNTVWMDGLDRSVNLAGLLLCLHGVFLTWFSPKDSSIRQFIQNILATGSFFQFTSNKSTIQKEAHARLKRYATFHRCPIRIMLILLNAHSVYLEGYVIFHLKHEFITTSSNVLGIITCQLNFILYVVVSMGFLKLAYRNYYLTLIFIKAVALKQGKAATYFREVPDSHLKGEIVETYFMHLHQLLLPLRQARSYLGLCLFVSIAAHLPSNALCITMALVFPMDLPARFLLISFAIIQLIVNGMAIYLAASVNGAVHDPSMHLLSAHIRNQRKNNGKDFQTRLFRWQRGNTQNHQLRFLLHLERHLDQFLTNSKRGYTNQYGMAFGTLGSITLLSAAKALFVYVKFLSFHFKRFLKPI